MVPSFKRSTAETMASTSKEAWLSSDIWCVLHFRLKIETKGKGAKHDKKIVNCYRFRQRNWMPMKRLEKQSIRSRKKTFCVKLNNPRFCRKKHLRLYSLVVYVFAIQRHKVSNWKKCGWYLNSWIKKTVSFKWRQRRQQNKN